MTVDEPTLRQIARNVRALQESAAEKDAAPLVTRDAVVQLTESMDELNRGVNRLGDGMRQLDMSIHDFERSTERSSNWMIGMTAAILLLTLAIAALTVVALGGE